VYRLLRIEEFSYATQRFVIPQPGVDIKCEQCDQSEHSVHLILADNSIATLSCNSTTSPSFLSSPSPSANPAPSPHHVPSPATTIDGTKSAKCSSVQAVPLTFNAIRWDETYKEVQSGCT
jgi:hypothetical protein